MRSWARHRHGVRMAAASVVAFAVLTGAKTCGDGRDGGPVTTRPVPVRPRREWPGTTGQVSRLVVWLRGTGPAGFALVVNTMQVDRRGARFVVEEGAFTFRLYATDAQGKPVLDKPIGEWRFDEAATHGRWSPGGWGGDATFTFLLHWQGPVPAPASSLLLVSEFTPRGRNVVVPHRLAFTMQRLPPRR